MVGLCFALAACGSSSPSTAPTIAPTAAPTAAPTVAATLAPTAAPATASPVAGMQPCDPANLAAAIVDWEAGAGHRTANVTLTNNGKADCTITAVARPQLVAGNGAILIDGAPAAASATLTLHYYDVVKTMVDAVNYCGGTPTAPVTVAFVFPQGKVTATPLNATDTSGVPPCTGSGSGGDVEMHPFAP